MVMTDHEYRMTQEMVLDMAQLASLLDTAAFLESIERAKSLGPLLDPTGYRYAMAQGGGDNLETIQRLAQAAHEMKAALREAGERAVRHAQQ